MARVIIPIIFILFSVFILTPSVFAKTPADTEAYFCQGNTIIHQIAGSTDLIPERTCSADEKCVDYTPSFESQLSNMASCIPNQSGPPSWGGGTGFYFPEPKVSNTPSVKLDNPVKFAITSNKRDTPSCFDEVKTDYIQSTNVFKDCKETDGECGCDTKTITVKDKNGSHKETVPCTSSDWQAPHGSNKYDGKQCWKEFECTAVGVGVFDIPFSPPTQACASNALIAIQPPPACTKSGNDNKTVPENNPDITSSSLDVHQRNADLMAKALLPPNFQSNFDKDKNKQNPVANVSAGFFSGLQNFVCGDTGIIGFLGKGFLQLVSGGQVCPRAVGLAIDKTEYFTSESNALASSTQPPGLLIIPAQIDCNISDYVGVKGDPNQAGSSVDMQGNTKITQIQGDLSGTCGIYDCKLPDSVKNQPPNPNALLSVDGKAFSQDQRVGRIQTDCNSYAQSQMPPGYENSICNNNGVSP